MSTQDRMTREERLAAKLRENLRRRKAQARAAGQGDVPAKDAPGGESAGLPKPPPVR
jgi:hypothetical protein